MDTRSVALIFLYVFVGFVVYVLVAIPPGTNWDRNIIWGDVAGWISGIGSMAAAIASVGIAAWGHRIATGEKRKTESSIARIFAVEAYGPMLVAVIALGAPKFFLQRLAEGNVAPHTPTSLAMAGEEKLVDLAARARDMAGLPLDVVEGVMRLRYAVTTYNDAVRGLSDSIVEAKGDPAAGQELEKLLRGLYEAIIPEAKNAVTELGRFDHRVRQITTGPFAPWA